MTTVEREHLRELDARLEQYRKETNMAIEKLKSIDRNRRLNENNSMGRDVTSEPRKIPRISSRINYSKFKP